MRLFVAFVPLAILLAFLSTGPEHRSYMPLVSVSAAAAEYPPLTWDSEDAELLGVTLERAECPDGCWRLTSLNILMEGEPEWRGLHHIFLKVFQMEQMPGIPWHVGASDPGDLVTKAAPDWADYAMFRGSCYDPFLGETGPHTLTVEPASDAVVGIGLPLCHHVEFYAVYVWMPGATP